MNFQFTEEQEAFRREVREFIEKEIPEDLLSMQIKEQGCSNPFSEEIYRKIAKRGWLGLLFPKEFGGQGKGHVDHFIFMEELERSGRVSWGIADGISITVNLFGRHLVNYGTEEQKKTWIPQILNGEVRFAVGMTEPNAGSDLAAIELKAEEDGDYYILNGSKLFNAGWLCTHIFAMAKTDWNVVPKHKGISNLIVDLKSDGVMMSSMLTHGDAKRSEVAFENVKVPKANMVGEKNRGFYMEVAGLAFERLQYVGGARIFHLFECLVDYVKNTQWEGKFLSEIPDVRYKLADIATEIEMARLISYHAAWLADRGTPSITESSMSWLFANESFERFANAALDILGERGLLESRGADEKWVPLKGRLAMAWRDSRSFRIGGGTSEIIRNAIAAGIGLPRK